MPTILSVNPSWPLPGPLDSDPEFGPSITYLRERGLRDVALTWALPGDIPGAGREGDPPDGIRVVWTARLVYDHQREPVAASTRPVYDAEAGARRALRSALALVGVFPEPQVKLMGRPGVPRAVVAEWVYQYREGSTLRQLEADYPYSYGAIRGNLLRAGVRMRNRGRIRRSG